ncbi:MAG: hypothetical protein WCV84_03395 [Patescibacteria group bacterium]
MSSEGVRKAVSVVVVVIAGVLAAAGTGIYFKGRSDERRFIEATTVRPRPTSPASLTTALPVAETERPAPVDVDWYTVTIEYRPGFRPNPYLTARVSGGYAFPEATRRGYAIGSHCEWEPDVLTATLRSRHQLSCDLAVQHGFSMEIRADVSSENGIIGYCTSDPQLPGNFRVDPGVRITATKNGRSVQLAPSVLGPLGDSGSPSCYLQAVDTPCPRFTTRLPSGGCWPTNPH